MLGRPFSLIESCLSVSSLLGILPTPCSRKRPPAFPNSANAGVVCTYIFLRGQPSSANGRRGAAQTTIFYILGLGAVRVRNLRICIYTPRSELLSVWPNTLQVFR